MPGVLLHCPIRGTLNVPEKAAGGLIYTEEKRRIDCIRFLLAKGYPPTYFKLETVLLRFGHQGKNSFRTDLVVLDIPSSNVSNDVEILVRHVKLVAEIKRDNAAAKLTKQTQVYPALDFIRDISALGVYWDDIEQKLFYCTLDGTKTSYHETAIAALPRWGQPLHAYQIKNSDLRSTNLRELFERIEDRLHTEITDKSQRFEIMLQLLLTKLYDERVNSGSQQVMFMQDFNASLLGDSDVIKTCNESLRKAIQFYGKYLPKAVSAKFNLSGAMLKSISSLLAPIQVLGSKRDVVQDFYMYFAQGVYKWDLAQYFTPTEVVDFIVSLVNPRTGDQVKDPACGSGDFLISAFHNAQRLGGDLRDAIWGADNSENAVQVSVLNMVLHGDGKSNIKLKDSLADVNGEQNQYSVVLCNPPFGTQIKDRRFEVLSNFDLGHEWRIANGVYQITDKACETQEVGLLFAEICVKQVHSGGRIGIILPNGYLGNKSSRYLSFREWLLRHTRLIAVIAFPRFTFKKSGADVSASVLILEKREAFLTRAIDSEDYPFYVGILESVGWSVSDKRSERIFKRDSQTGIFLTNSDNEYIIDADFDRILKDFRTSTVADVFPWILNEEEPLTDGQRGWSVNIHRVLERPDLSIDPKRWCERTLTVRQQIEILPHFALGDVIEIISETGIPGDKTALYEHVELQNVFDGIVTPHSKRGWELPDRARHSAQGGDIFIGKIWGSIGKWFVAGGDCSHLVVSNGFYRMRLKPGKEDFLVDILAGLNTEAYRIQARAFCTGSDGLAELSEVDLPTIILPKLIDAEARDIMQQRANVLLVGRATVASVVEGLLQQGKINTAHVKTRSTNWVQV